MGEFEVGRSIFDFLQDVVGEVVGNLITAGSIAITVSQTRTLSSRLRPHRNADLERIAIRALRSALQDVERELQKHKGDGGQAHSLSGAERDLFRKWDERLAGLLSLPDDVLLAATSYMPPDAPTLISMNEHELASTLFTQLSKQVEPTAIPEEMEQFLKRHLPRMFKNHYWELLKDRRHERAWNAFLRQMLEAIFQAIGGLPGHICKLVEEQIIKKQGAILSLLEAEPERWEQRAEQLKQEIKQPILEALEAMQQRLDYIVSLIGERHSYRLLHEQTLQYINFCMQEMFVGREEILGNLEDFLAKRQAGIVVLIAPAGYGKTRLMMHLLARLQRRSDIKTVYHLFTNHEALKGLGTEVRYAYAHLLLQIGLLKGEPVHLPDDNPNELLSTLYYQIKGLTESQKPLVILIDGLDEANEPIHHLPLPDPLPQGVFVIVSARWDGQGEPPPYLEAWCQHANQVFSLETLTENDLREWLTREDRLRRYAEDDKFVRMLHQRTEGLPLHARYLIDDLKHADNPPQKLREAPQGFSNYIDQQVRHLARHVSNAQASRKMFALLTVAKGAMPEADLQELCDLSNLDLMNLPQPIRRWFLVSEAGWQFTHPRLAAEFRHTRRLVRDANKMEQELLAYCARWRERKSPYALRYYAAHLAERAATDADAAEQLYALMEDEEFLQAQRAAFPNQPELPLSVLRQAMEVAIQRDEPVPLARALLLHAQRVGETRLQSPYRIWRETDNLDYALKVADLHPPRVRPLWYLLLASEQPDREQRKDILDRLAKQVLQKGVPSCLVEHSPYLDIACALLVDLANDIDEAMFVRLKSLFSAQNWLHWLNQLIDAGYNALARQWLEWFRIYLELSDLFELAKILGRLGLYPLAIEYAQKIGDRMKQSGALAAIAKAQAQANLLKDARGTFQLARNSAKLIGHILLRSEALALISIAQAETPELYEDAKETLEEAIQAYKEYQNPYHPVVDRDEGEIDTLLAIAVAQLRLELVEEARLTFGKAIQIAKQIDECEERNKAIVSIIQTQAGEHLLEQSLQSLQIIDWAPCRDIALISIAQAQAQKGLFADAYEIVQKVEWDLGKIEILTTVAVVKVRTGRLDEALTDFQEAFRIVQRMRNSESRKWGLEEITQAQARVGFYDDALITITGSMTYDISKALQEIAVAQAQVQLILDALQTTQKIEQTYDRDVALFRISEECVKERKLSEALELAQQIEDIQYRIVALCTVAEAYLREENLGRAEKIYEDAHQTATHIEDESTRIVALCNIYISQRRTGFREAYTTAQGIPNHLMRMVSNRNTFILPDWHPYTGADYRRSVYSLPDALCACAVLIRAYPEHAREISAEVMRAIGG